MHIADCENIVNASTMPAELTFTAPRNVTSHLKTLDDGDLLSFLRKLPWSFLQSLIQSWSDFNNLDPTHRILESLSAEFGDVFDDITTETSSEEVLKIFRTIYLHVDGTGHTNDQIIGVYVRNWSSHVNESSGKTTVAQVLDLIFIRESKFAGISPLLSCLGVSGYRPGSDAAEKFCERNSLNRQVVSRLFSFFQSKIPITTAIGFVSRLFPEDCEVRLCTFKEHRTEGLVKDHEPSDVQDLASSLFPPESLSPSVSAGSKVLPKVLID